LAEIEKMANEKENIRRDINVVKSEYENIIITNEKLIKEIDMKNSHVIII
jgi:hypothetical protein